MNVSITTFVNPFSFFCKALDGKNEQFQVADAAERQHVYKSEISDLSHGQYVTILWNNQWTRGVVNIQDCILIWLIDYGIYFHPDDKTMFMHVSEKCKKMPTKVFEASLHGVSPVDKELSDDCEIVNKVTTTWNKGATEAVLALLQTASNVVFLPVALLTTNANDIVLGDLYLKIGNVYVNIIDKLEKWPVYLERNKENYIKCLPEYYSNSHKKHWDNATKPQFPEFEPPAMTLATTLVEYHAICDKAPEPPNAEDEESSSESSGSSSVGCSTVVGTFVGKPKKEKPCFELTTAQEEEYSCLWVTLGGEEYNMLDLIKMKLQDFKMCEKYKNMKKGLGRACSRGSFAW